MPKGSTVFAQIMSLIPRRQFNNCVARYNGDYRIRNFSCYDQFLVMSMAQYANKNSLRDIKADIRRLIELECCEAEPEAVLSSAGLGYLIGKMRAVDKDWEESY